MAIGANREQGEGESGQVLILCVVFLSAMMMFLVLIIDGGLLVMKHRNTQNVVDAVALAGAQELPDDPAAAVAVAREYAALNDIDPNSITITFSCTSTNLRLCDASAGKYDTINVTTSQQAPALFGGILSVVGAGDSCWVGGCSTQLEAAACTGVCGAGTAKVDVVVSIDHTGSMSATDLQNAKDGALTLMRTMDSSAQRVGLGVTPPVHPTDLCDTIEDWTQPSTWLPVPMNDQYQTSAHVLNAGSALISTTNCLDRATGSSDVPGPHTDLASPMKFAMAEMAANGRSDAEHAIVLFTDGAANIWNSAEGLAYGALGPCDYAVKMGQAAQAAGYIVYTIAYGADENCTHELPGSPWANQPADDVIEAMASSGNFFDAPRTSDLDPIFEMIGVELAGGSKLVK
jgi:hypothetical protein